MKPIRATDQNLPSTSSDIFNNDNISVDNDTNKKQNFNDWGGAAISINKARKVLDESVVLLPKVLEAIKSVDWKCNEPISDSSFVHCNNMYGSPNYNKLYQHLGAIVSSRSTTKMKRFILL